MNKTDSEISPWAAQLPIIKFVENAICLQNHSEEHSFSSLATNIFLSGSVFECVGEETKFRIFGNFGIVLSVESAHSCVEQGESE